MMHTDVVETLYGPVNATVLAKRREDYDTMEILRLLDWAHYLVNDGPLTIINEGRPIWALAAEIRSNLPSSLFLLGQRHGVLQRL